MMIGVGDCRWDQEFICPEMIPFETIGVGDCRWRIVWSRKCLNIGDHWIPLELEIRDKIRILWAQWWLMLEPIGVGDFLVIDPTEANLYLIPSLPLEMVELMEFLPNNASKKTHLFGVTHLMWNQCLGALELYHV